jgi:signal transduction histidine kinase
VSAFGRVFGVLLRWRSPTGQVTAWAIALIAPPAIAAATGSFRASLGLTGFLFCALLVVILVALIGGRRPALVAVVVGFFVAEYGFTVPYDTFALHVHASDAPLVVFVVVGAAVAILVDHLARLLEEQTSLRRVESAVRRVATLVARAASAEELFAAAAEEVGELFAVDLAGMARFEADGTVTILAGWRGDGEGLPVGSRAAVEDGSLSALVAATGRPARVESPSEASRSIGALLLDAGIRSAVAVPITVQARLWGVMVAGSTADKPLPASTEARLADFTELLATSVANAESNAWLARLAEEQAALRRVATLVARGAPPEEVFAAVAEEVVRMLGTYSAVMGRYGSDGTLVSVARSGGPAEHLPVGSRHPLGGKNLATIVFETGRPARVDNYAETASGPIGAAAHEVSLRSSVGTPITVEGRLWGLIAAGSTLDTPLPADTEARLGSFTELVATSVANAESRAGIALLAEEQAALRHVATLVARGVPAGELFKAVAAEVGRVLSAEYVHLIRYERDDTATVLAAFGRNVGTLPAGTRLKLGGKNATTLVFETGRSARIDNYDDASGPFADAPREGDARLRSSVATPIFVEANLWGVVVVGCSDEQSLPVDTEARLAEFTELVAMAIANTESRAGLAQLADEQEALRRVATLVAGGAPPEQVFAAVTEEVERLFLSDGAALARFESDGTFTIVASAGELFPVGSRWPIGGDNVTTTIFQTSRPARIDNLIATGPLADEIREAGVRSSVGTPIIVEGHLWGVAGVVSTREALPPDMEVRLMDFTELVAMAIANAQSRAALRPVERMRSQAEQITEHQLSGRLSVSDDPGEVTALGRTLNEMLDRVEEAVARERRVVSDASHELRTPLTTLRAEVELALMGDRDTSELRAALESASEEAKRMSRLADDLLVLARADQGRLPLHPQPLVARELLEAAVGRAHAGAEVRGRSIAVAELGDRCAVRADPDRAAQALDNLVTNALLYGDGTITLSAQSKQAYVEVHVCDEGPGFPDDLLPRAFERFGRGQHARSNEPGSGLGLALVEAVALAHGGHAEACNRPDGGADVSFTLPRAY